MRKIIALLGVLTALAACAPITPNTSSGGVPSTARKIYVGGYVKRAEALLPRGRMDVTISAIGGQTDPGRPGSGGFGGIPDGPVSTPWEKYFLIEADYDKTITVNLTLTYIAPAAMPDELTCYVSTSSYLETGDGPMWRPTVLDTLTVRAKASRGGSSVLVAYCLVAIPPLRKG